MKSETTCSKCGDKYKVKSEQVFGIENLLVLVYCPNCQEVHPEFPTLTTLKGKALRKISKKTGEVRIKGILPEEWANRDVIVKTFPKIVVTKPSELRIPPKGKVYMTKERTAKVYPELKRGDVAIASGVCEEGILYSVMMLNQTLGITSEFIESEIKLKKGIFSSFNIRNPILVQSEDMIKSLSENLKVESKD